MRRLIARLRRSLLDRLVLRPTRHPVDAKARQSVTITTSLGRVECYVHADRPIDPDTRPPAGLDLLVLKFPGTGGRAERSTAAPTQDLPAGRFKTTEVWTWNPPGYGRSEGRATLEGIGRAATEMAQRVITRRTSPSTTVWLVGNSLGCVQALRVAKTFDRADHAGCPDGMILRNPPQLDVIVKRIADRYPFGRLMYPVADSLPVGMNAIRLVEAIELPILFLESEFDELVLPSEQRRIRDTFAGPKYTVLLAGIGHDGPLDDSHGEALRRGIRWLCDRSV